MSTETVCLPAWSWSTGTFLNADESSHLKVQVRRPKAYYPSIKALSRLGSFRPVTPCTALVQGRYAVLNSEANHVLSELRNERPFPTNISATTAFYLLAHENQYSSEYTNYRLREKAFSALQKAFIEKRDSLTDYVQALWLIANVYEIPFLSQGQNAEIRSIENPFDPQVAPWIKLHDYEKIRLLQILVARDTGPIRCSVLQTCLENLSKIGELVRVLLFKNSAVTLRLTRLKDAGFFISNILPYTKNGECHQPWAKRYGKEFSFKITQFEYSKSKVEQDQVLIEALETFKANNPSIIFKEVIDDYSERVKNKQEQVAPSAFQQEWFPRYYRRNLSSPNEPGN